MAELKPYRAYKDSGVEWLGAVPAHWEVRRAKHVFRRIVGGSTPSSDDSRYWGNVHVWVTPADVSRSTRIRGSQRQLTQEGLLRCPAELMPAGSIVVTSRAPVGNVALAEVPFCTNQGCKALVPNTDEIDSAFAFNLLRALQAELQSLAKGTTFTEVSGSTVGDVRLPLPPLPEQAAIVRFLDHADRRIRHYIGAKEKLIALLEEQKQAVIHEAVTGQIDVRTERPFPAYKDSGVGWLRPAPLHWEALKLRQVLRRNTERERPDLPLLSVVREQGVILRDTTSSDENHNYIPDDLSNYKVVRAGQFVMNKMKAWQGSYGVSSHDGIVSPAYFVFDVFGLRGDFFHAAIRSRAYVPAFTRASDGVRIGQWDLSEVRMRDIRFLVPPTSEQSAIVGFLDDATRNIDAAIAASRRQIESVSEYRSRLIADVVTGKLDVRDAAAALPEFDPLAADGILQGREEADDARNSRRDAVAAKRDEFETLARGAGRGAEFPEAEA